MAFIYKLAIVATALAMVSSAPVTDRYTTATEIPATDTTAFSEPIVTAAALLTADVVPGSPTLSAPAAPPSTPTT